MSCSSKWRIPSVRTIASRAIANTSGRMSSRASRIAWFSRFRRALASSRRRSRSGWWSSSSVGSSGEDRLAELVADRREPLADLRVGQGLDLFLEIVGLVDERLDPLQLTVVRIDEPGKESQAWAVKYRWQSPTAPFRSGARDRFRRPRPVPSRQRLLALDAGASLSYEPGAMVNAELSGEPSRCLR